MNLKAIEYNIDLCLGTTTIGSLEPVPLPLAKKIAVKSGRKAPIPLFQGVLFVLQTSTDTATVLLECR